MTVEGLCCIFGKILICSSMNTEAYSRELHVSKVNFTDRFTQMQEAS